MTTEKTIYLITPENTWGNDLAEQLNYFNYRVQVFNQFEQLQTAINALYPDAIIVDMAILNEQITSWLINIKNSPSKLPLPIIYSSTSGALDVHLQAVRSGGDAFFVCPTDVMNLAVKLDILCGTKPAEPYRILIVEDTLSLSKYYEAILQKAGMSCVVINNPLQAAQPLVEFRPDLILTDLYMPQCTGIELATMIRQQDIFAAIPILYLSSEEDKAKQSLAMGSGGDDFLTKPIVPEDLVTIVQRRAQRARLVGSMISKDSLTGLLNHTAIQERLHTEIARAARQKSDFVFAMIDLDHFKQINDTHGHQIGDLVITNLCRLLLKRLRRTDIAGRYGGEEFSLILPDTNMENALKICNQIRENFAQLNSAFKATFSVGAASYSDYKDADSLTNAADRALYDAKKTGRNKVVAAKCLASVP